MRSTMNIVCNFDVLSHQNRKSRVALNRRKALSCQKEQNKTLSYLARVLDELCIFIFQHRRSAGIIFDSRFVTN